MLPRLIVTGVVICSAALLQAATDVKSAVPFRSVTLEAALQAAQQEHKLVLIDFYTTWCEPCKRLDADTWANEGVGRLVGEKTVPLKLDAEKEGKAAAERFKIDAYPTVLLLKPDGSVVDRLVGYREPGAFTTDFNSALAGKPSLARAVDAVSAAKSDHAAVQARYDLGRALARQGDAAGALNEFLWCFDTGMPGTSFSGVRVSFLLGEIARLGRSFPPALEALAERRDAAEQRLLADASDRNAVTDFAAICGELGDDGRLLKVFDQLPANDPRRRAFGLRAFRILLPRQRYADAVSVMPFAAMDRLVDATTTRVPAGANQAMLESMRRSSVNSMFDYIEALAGAGELDHARALIDRLANLDASPETQAELAAHLKRAGQPDLLKPAKL